MGVRSEYMFQTRDEEATPVRILAFRCQYVAFSRGSENKQE